MSSAIELTMIPTKSLSEIKLLFWRFILKNNCENIKVKRDIRRIPNNYEFAVNEVLGNIC